MSRQLAIASAFSVFALSALALFAPIVDAGPEQQAGAASVLAAPDFSVELPLAD